MGFYFRKSISAGPFRFNLSGAGVGMSVGVKGFRVGTGPRGNYVHMGRGGLYYRASLGGGRRQARQAQKFPQDYNPLPVGNEQAIPIETGNVFEMLPSNGSELLQEINEKLSLLRIWPWTLCVGLLLSFVLGSQPTAVNAVLPTLFLTLVLTVIAWWWDQSRKAVVVMYDLSDDVAEKFRSFSDELERVGQASRLWNIDTAANTNDWKRNAGAGRLLTRKPASILDLAPGVVRTNISVPCIKGGKQSLHFFPDIVLIEGGKAGALSYEQLNILWNTTIFIETEAVPPDSQVVGHTWRFVNKNGSPDRRFNNNRQIPQVRYQQMGVQGAGGLQKILHISKVVDRSPFDAALQGLRAQVRALDTASKDTQHAPKLLMFQEGSDSRKGDRSPLILAAIIIASLIIAVLLYLFPPNLNANIETQAPAAATSAPNPAPTPPPVAPRAAMRGSIDAVLQKQVYRGPGNRGNYETDKMRVVTDFYRALELGDGHAAVAFVVPENAQRGSLSAAALTAKFSGLTEPLNLDNVQQRANGTVRVRYSYTPASGLKCVGLATVNLIEAVPDPLISHVRFNELCR